MMDNLHEDSSCGINLQRMCVAQIRLDLFAQSFPYEQIKKFSELPLFWESLDDIFRPYCYSDRSIDKVVIPPPIRSATPPGIRKLPLAVLLKGFLGLDKVASEVILVSEGIRVGEVSKTECNLHSLYLTDTFDIDDHYSVDWLFATILPYIFPNLTRIIINNLPLLQISDYSLSVIATYYADSMIELNLCGCTGISQQGLSQTLPHIHTLKRIIIRDCHISLSRWLLPQALTDVDIGGNMMSAMDAQHLLVDLAETSADSLLFLGIYLDRSLLRSLKSSSNSVSSYSSSKKHQQILTSPEDLALDTHILSRFHNIQGLDMRGWTLKEAKVKNNSATGFGSTVHDTFSAFMHMTAIDLGSSTEVLNPFVNEYRYGSLIDHSRHTFGSSSSSISSSISSTMSSSRNNNYSNTHANSVSSGGKSNRSLQTADFAGDVEAEFTIACLSAIAQHKNLCSLSLARRCLSVADLNMVVYASYAPTLIYLDLSYNTFFVPDNEGLLSWSFANLSSLEVLMLRNCGLCITRDYAESLLGVQVIENSSDDDDDDDDYDDKLDINTKEKSCTIPLFPASLKLLDLSDNVNLQEGRGWISVGERGRDENISVISSILAKSIRPLRQLEALFVKNALGDSAYLKGMIMNKPALQILDIGGVDVSVEEFNEAFANSTENLPELIFLGLERCRLLNSSIHLIEPGILPRLLEVKADDSKLMMFSMLTGDMDEAIIDRIVTMRSKIYTFNGLPGTNYKPSQEKYDDDDEDGSSRSSTSSPTSSRFRKKGGAGGKRGESTSSKGGGSRLETKETKGLGFKTATITNTTVRTDRTSGGDQMDKLFHEDYYRLRGIALHSQLVSRLDNRGVSHLEEIRYIGLSPTVNTAANHTTDTTVVGAVAAASSIVTGEASVPLEGGDGDIEEVPKSDLSLDLSSMKTDTGDDTAAIGGVLTREQILSLRTKLIAQFPPPNLTYMY